MDKLKKIFYILDAFVISFAGYILLDTFVIPKAEMTMQDTGTTDTDTTNTTDDGKTSETTNKTSGVYTENSYTDDNITVKITKYRENDTDIYVADIQVKNIENLRRGFANNTYGRNVKATTSDIAESVSAILAINGDYYGFRNNGYVVANGTSYRSTSNSDEDLVIFSDGSFAIIDEDNTSLADVMANPNKYASSSENVTVWQVFSFGPALVDSTGISVTADTEVAQSMNSNPRTAVGIISNGHYVFVVSDGRTSSNAGLSLYQLAQFMQGLGCTVAYNLDGGGSSTMYFNGKVVNNPTSGNTSGEREVSDILYVGY